MTLESKIDFDPRRRPFPLCDVVFVDLGKSTTKTGAALMTLPPIPEGRDWSPETWQAGWEEACRLSKIDAAWHYTAFPDGLCLSVYAHAITLLEAGIVKSVVSEAAAVWDDAHEAYCTKDGGASAIAVIQAALDKARAGG